MRSQISAHLDYACLTMPVSICQDGGYITTKEMCTILYLYKLFHHQCYGIIHPTAGSVASWSMRCILMRNSDQSSSAIVQTSVLKVLPCKFSFCFCFCRISNKIFVVVINC